MLVDIIDSRLVYVVSVGLTTDIPVPQGTHE